MRTRTASWREALARRGPGGAVAWTLLQHLSFFLMAWLVSHAAGAEAFGALGQALALSAVLAVAVTVRFEYAAQLESRQPLADALFALARRMGCAAGAAVALAAALGAVFFGTPGWMLAGACAVAPLACLQVEAARQARAGRVAAAAALRAGPALAMLPLQGAAWACGAPEAVAWSVPAAAWACLLLPAARPGGAGLRSARRMARLARTRYRFVRNEWLGLLLNLSANHGQILLVGALADSAAAGTMALALRIAMLPTSLFGLAWGDWLRSRIVPAGPGAAARHMVLQALRWMAALSAGVHLAGAAVLSLALVPLFPHQGEALLAATLALLPLACVRLVASPLAFLLAWRGWLGWSLLGQCLLFAAAFGSVAWGLAHGGVAAVAAAYTLAASGVYVAYILFGLRAVRADT